MSSRSRPLPKNIELIPGMDSITIRRKWFGPKAFFLLFFVLFWDGFLVIWYTIAFGQDNAPLVMILFPLIHVTVGIFLTYSAVASFINKTDITISPSTFTVRSYPLKWMGDRSMPVAEIRQLYTARKVTRTKNGTSVSYQLRVISDRQSEFKILGGQASKEECLTVEEEIESIIGLKDRPVEGEVER